MSSILLNKYGHYIQSIKYPTVPKGEERLSIKHTHKIKNIDNLLEIINKIQLNNYF